MLQTNTILMTAEKCAIMNHVIFATVSDILKFR